MDSRYPPNETPSQYGEPCPKGEGDDTSRYAALIDDVVMVFAPLLPIVVFGVIIYFRWFA